MKKEIIEGKNKPVKAVITNDDKTKETFTNFLIFGITENDDTVDINVSECLPKLSGAAFYALAESLSVYLIEIIGWMEKQADKAIKEQAKES